MSRDLSDINASSRSEMVCPECWERGLAGHQRRVQAYDSDKDKIIHASGCRTEDCKHHYKEGEPIPAKVIEMQLGAGRSFNPKEIVARTSLKTVGVILGISLFGVALLIAVTGLPFLSDPGGSGVASADTNVSKADGSISEVGGGPNWTIYKYGDQYVVAGTNSNGETVYLNGNGEVVDSVHFFDTEQDAIEAIEQWEQIALENPDSTIDPDARNISSPELDSPWSVFKVNSSAYVVAAENSEGNIVFLNPDGSVTVEPHFYDTQKSAEEALIEWNLDNLPSSEYNETTASEVENVLNDGTTSPISGGGGGGGSDGSDSDSLDGNESEGQFNVTEVTGAVTGPSGEPLTNATVTVHTTGEQTTTNANGEYTISNVPEGTHQLSVIPSQLESAAAPRVGTFSVTDTGDIEFDDAPQSVVYFVDSDGDVANNKIDWSVPDPQKIRATGNGTDIQTEVSFLNSKNANNVSVTLKPVATSSKQTLNVGENWDKSFQIDGNLPPSNATLSVGRISASQLIQDSGNIGGNQQATVTNRGDLPAPLNITINGDQWSKSESNSGTANPGNSIQIGKVGGDAPAQNAQITVTGKEAVAETYSDISKGWSTDTDNYVSGVHRLFTPNKAGEYKFDYSLEVSTYEGNAEATIIDQDWEESGDQLAGTESAAIRSLEPGRDYDSASGSASITFTEEDLKYDEKDDSGWFGPVKHNYDHLSLKVSESPKYDCSGYSCYQTIDADITNLRRVETTQDITVKAGGETINISPLNKGESRTIDLPGLEPGDEVTVKTEGEAGFDYNIEWDETHYTNDVSVQDDNGNTVHTFDGAIGPNNERSVQISAPEFESGKSVSLSSEKGAFSYETSYQQTVYPDSGTITINGDEYRYPQDIGHDETIDINSLTLGENTIAISTDPVNGISPGLNATLNYVGDAVQTKNPTVTVSGNGSSKTLELNSDQLNENRLAEPHTLDLPQSLFTTGNNTIRVQAEEGSRVIAEFKATGLRYQANRFTREGEAG